MFPYKIASRVAFLVLAATTACASPITDDGVASSGDAISSSSVTKLVVRLRPVPRETAVPGTCTASGEWALDFATAHLEGEACIADSLDRVDRALTHRELQRVRAAVEGILTTGHATGCSRDLPVASLRVTQGGSEQDYITRTASCSTTAIPVVPRTIERLVDVMLELTEAKGVDAGAGAVE